MTPRSGDLLDPPLAVDVGMLFTARGEAQRVADAAALPFEDGAFDAVLSSFGVMFAPDQQAVAGDADRSAEGQSRSVYFEAGESGFGRDVVLHVFRDVGKHERRAR